MRRFVTTAGGVAVLGVIVVCVNILASRLHWRADATEGDLYTLSEGSRKLVEGLDEPMEVTLFFSRSNKGLPIFVKNYAERVTEFLEQFATASGGRLTVATVDPKPDTDEEEAARKFGVQPVRLPDGDEVFFGLRFKKGTVEAAIPYLDPRREEFLEYDLSQAFFQLMHPEKKAIGLISSLPVDGNPMQGQEPWFFIQELRKNFDVKKIDQDDADLSSFSLLLLIHPKGMSERLQFKVDQYLMGGGRILAFLDPFSRTDLAAAAPNPGQQPQPFSDAGKLPAAWGVDMEAGKMVGDLGAAATIMAGGTRLDYPFFLNLAAPAFAADQMITRSLNQLLLPEAGSFKPADGSALNYAPLVRSTAQSGTVDTGMAMYMGPEQMMRDLKPDGQRRDLAVMVSGKFKSAFAAGPPAGLPEAEVNGFKAEASAENTIVLVADADFIFDANAVDVFRFAGQAVARPRNDNLAFAMNAVEFLSGSHELISIRSKGKLARPFTKVQELQSGAQQRWKEEEDQLSAKLEELQAKINDLQKQRTDGASFMLTKEQSEEIEKFRLEEAEVRKRRREVRKNLREDIEALGKKLTAANLLVIPGLVCAGGTILMVRRSRKGDKSA